MSDTTPIKARNLSGGDRVLCNGRPIAVWSVAIGARTVRVTYDVPGQTKAESRATYAHDCELRRVVR